MKTSAKWHFTPLTNDQKARLSILAKEAWAIAQGRGAVEDGVKFDDWRYTQQLEACGVASLRDANQSHFLNLRGKWFTVIGNLELAFYDLLNAGEQNEKTRQMKWRLMGFVAVLADGIKAEKARIQIVIDEAQAAKEAWSYTLALAADKGQGRRLESFGPDDLEQLCHTVINRANAKLGKGRPENRNKSQRAGKRAKKPADDAALEPFERHSNRDEQPPEIVLTQPLSEREPQPF